MPVLKSKGSQRVIDGGDNDKRGDSGKTGLRLGDAETSQLSVL